MLFYARGQKYQAACEPRNLCTGGEDEAQNHGDRINRNVMREAIYRKSTIWIVGATEQTSNSKS